MFWECFVLNWFEFVLKDAFQAMSYETSDVGFCSESLV